MEYPKVSIIIPTLNSASVLKDCLESINIQDYPKNKMEVIIGDGGSVDETVEIARNYGANVVPNPLKTGEAGKATALKEATGEYIALIDSDNILPDEHWLTQMIEPLLKHKEALGSEPIKYVSRKKDGFITRYCALIGMNDPFVMFLGNYDRICTLTGKWTEVECEEINFGDYILVTFNHKIPTIGGNGTVFRADFLKTNVVGNYLFDIDILAEELKKSGHVHFIKVKNGIVHTYCENNIYKFARKQQRRVKDMIYHRSIKHDRAYEWYNQDIFGKNPWRALKFVLFCVTFFPLLYQMLIGYLRKPDYAWLFHPLACEITLVIYGWYRIFGRFGVGELNRKNWRQ